ncbi:MAG: hypothetical protein IT580_02740 [Verrucomicrobiales bacterium]|nr:hypothetical protein [Verrucomicrobiales bacterium]
MTESCSDKHRHRKPVMLNPTIGIYIERSMRALSAREIRQEWFRSGGSNFQFGIGGRPAHHGKSDLLWRIAHFEGFGALALDRDEVDKSGFIGLISNTDLMESVCVYDRTFIIRDVLGKRTCWHILPVLADPWRDLYLPIGQATLTLQTADFALRVSLRSLAPNFLRFEIHYYQGEWTASEAWLPWRIEPCASWPGDRALSRFGLHALVAVGDRPCGPRSSLHSSFACGGRPR